MILAAANPSVSGFFGSLSVGSATVRYLVAAFTVVAVLMAFRQIRRVMHQLRLADEAARIQRYHDGAGALEPATQQRHLNNRDVWLS